MARRQTVKVEGLRELERALKELPRATGKNVLRRALTKAGAPIEADAERLAPVRTGHLVQSIGTGRKLTRRQRKQHRPESPVEVFVGAAEPKAHLQEFGTGAGPAQPFLRPAFDSNKMRALDMVKTELATEIEKARARLARKAAREAAKMKGSVR